MFCSKESQYERWFSTRSILRDMHVLWHCWLTVDCWLLTVGWLQAAISTFQSTTEMRSEFRRPSCFKFASQRTTTWNLVIEQISKLSTIVTIDRVDILGSTEFPFVSLVPLVGLSQPLSRAVPSARCVTSLTGVESTSASGRPPAAGAVLGRPLEHTMAWHNTTCTHYLNSMNSLYSMAQKDWIMRQSKCIKMNIINYIILNLIEPFNNNCSKLLRHNYQWFYF